MAIREVAPTPRGIITGKLIYADTPTNRKLNRVGKIVQQQTVKNLVTNMGEGMLAYWTKGDIVTKGYVTHMSLCDSSASAAETDESEIGSNKGPRVAVSSVTVTLGVVHFEGSWSTAQANYTIRRCYLFSAASGGNLFATAAFDTPFVKTSEYTFLATWEETYEN